MALLSPPDPRDYEMQNYLVGNETLPATFTDYVDKAAEVKNQKGNSCVGHALASVIDIVELKDAHRSHGMVLLPTSPGWIYYHRTHDGDYGMYVRTAFRNAQKIGSCLTRDFPGSGIKRQREGLDDNLYAAAANYKIKSYARVRTVREAKSALVQYGPVLIVVPVYNDAPRPFIWRGSDLNGFHAMSLYGWNRDGFIVRNSWGRDFADGGYVTLPFEDWRYVTEAWSVVDAKSPRQEPIPDEESSDANTCCSKCVIV